MESAWGHSMSNHQVGRMTPLGFGCFFDTLEVNAYDWEIQNLTSIRATLSELWPVE